MLAVVAALIVLTMPSAGWTQDASDKQRIMELLKHVPTRQVPDDVAAGLTLRNCVQAALKVLKSTKRISNNTVVAIYLHFSLDGELAEKPKIMNPTLDDPDFMFIVDKAVQAVHTCVPLKPVPSAPYDGWKNIVLKIRPADLN
jgi:hypothetical protein